MFGKEEGRGGVPDGMRVDKLGNVYVTGPGGIWVWDLGGTHLGTIMMPESTANFNWGDPNIGLDAGTFGQITTQNGDPRILQFAIKYGF